MVLIAVFIPMAFFGGAVGAIYRQFSLAMVASMVFSAILALSLTPALCATLLKPIEREGIDPERRIFRLVQSLFVAPALVTTPASAVSCVDPYAGSWCMPS